MANQIYSVVFEGGAVATLDHVAHIYHGGKDILKEEEEKEDAFISFDEFVGESEDPIDLIPASSVKHWYDILNKQKEFTHKISMKEDMLGSVDEFEEWLKEYEFYYVRENSPDNCFTKWEVIFLIKINSATELKFVGGFLKHAYVKYTVEEVK